MAIFRFRLLTPSGKVDRGVVELPFTDDAPAIRYLERQGGVVISITRLGRAMSALTKLATQGFSRVKRSELAEFFNNMAMLMGAGVPVLSKIPVLKRLYSARNLVKDEQVLLILVKPTIIIQREQEEAAFPTFGQR